MIRYEGKHASVRVDSFREAVEVAQRMRNARGSSSKRGSGVDDPFYEYETFEEACSSFVSGVDGPREIIETLRESVRRRVASLDLAVFRFDNSYIGTYLDVDSFVSGEPDHMLAPFEDLERRRERFVRIVVDNAFSARVPTKDIRTRGAAIIALCDVLNLAGYSTEVFVSSGSHDIESGRTMALVVPVQRVGDPWDIRSAAFPLASGDFSRRLKFAVTEGLEEPWRSMTRRGYGRPLGTVKGGPVDLEVGGADVIVDAQVGSLADVVRDPFAWIMSKCRNLGIIGDDETGGQ